VRVERFVNGTTGVKMDSHNAVEGGWRKEGRKEEKWLGGVEEKGCFSVHEIVDFALSDTTSSALLRWTGGDIEPYINRQLSINLIIPIPGFGYSKLDIITRPSSVFLVFGHPRRHLHLFSQACSSSTGSKHGIP
jgi:hypothetical protein